MAGTIPLSMTQQFDALGNPLVGGKLYIIQAGTVSAPQIAYQDSALTIPVSGGSVITLDAAARIPQFFLADGSIKIRLTDSNGVEQVTADGILVVGASSGGGGGSPVDATTILATGDLKARYGTGVLSGFVRSNGRTIGSATSGATERANADTQSLFEYLWTADANLSVSTGRGASANADWVANKTIALPDWRGRDLSFLDDMGNSAAGRLTLTYFGTSPIVLGAASTGLERRTLLPGNLPPYTPTGTITNHDFLYNDTGTIDQASATAVGIPIYRAANKGVPVINFDAQGGLSTPFSIKPPSMLATLYIKL